MLVKKLKEEEKRKKRKKLQKRRKINLKVTITFLLLFYLYNCYNHCNPIMVVILCARTIVLLV